MPMIMREVSIAAGATNENLIAGSAFEFARGRGVLSIGIAAAATGVVALAGAAASPPSSSAENAETGRTLSFTSSITGATEATTA